MAYAAGQAAFVAFYSSDNFEPPTNPTIRMMLAAGFITFEKLEGE